MGAALLPGLFAAALIPWGGGGDDASVEEDPVATDRETDPDTGDDGGPNFIEVGPLVEGTDESDIFNLDNAPRQNGYLASVVINANGGDDIIALTPESGTAPQDFGPDAFYRSSISGGDGNDIIEIGAEGSTISGDDGNDTIIVYNASGSDILGGAGDDKITVTQGASERMFIDGGSGNDTIDGRDTDNGRILGGDGDDVLLFSGANPLGTGYVLNPDGGAGDDVLIYKGSPIPPSNNPYDSPFAVNGGEGSDTFRITFDEGRTFSDTRLPEDTDPPRMDLIRIGDFEPGFDTLEIDAFVTNSAYELSEVRLEEEGAATNVVVSFTSETEVDHDVIIKVNATGMGIDDLVLPDGLACEEVA